MPTPGRRSPSAAALILADVSTADVVSVVSTFFAAVAAIAAWAAVRDARRAQIEAEMPQLAFRVVPSGNTCDLLIENVGQGIAIFVGFLITSGDGRASEGYTFPPSNLWPTKLARSQLPFVTVEGAKGIVFCADRRGNLHSWNDGVGYAFHRKPKGGVGRRPTQEVFRELYGDVPGFDSLVYLPATPSP